MRGSARTASDGDWSAGRLRASAIRATILRRLPEPVRALPADPLNGSRRAEWMGGEARGQAIVPGSFLPHLHVEQEPAICAWLIERV